VTTFIKSPKCLEADIASVHKERYKATERTNPRQGFEHIL